MVKKKLFLALGVCAFAVAGAAAVGFSGNHFGFVAADTTYRAVLSEGNAKTDAGNELNLTTSGLTESAGNYGVLAAGGYIDVEVNGAKSIIVNADTHTNLTLSLGYKEGVWFKEDLTGWILEDDAVIELKDQPNFVRIEATADTTIESITYNYSCTPTALNNVYLNGGSWTSDFAWFWAYVWDNNGYDSKFHASSYYGNGVYLFEIPEIFNNGLFVRTNPNVNDMSFDSIWNKSVNLELSNNALFVFKDWGKDGVSNFTKSEATEIAYATFGLIGTFNGWAGDVPLEMGEDGFWFVEYTFEANAKFKIRENGKWDISFGDSSGGDVEITEEGTYLVRLGIVKGRVEVLLDLVA